MYFSKKIIIIVLVIFLTIFQYCEASKKSLFIPKDNKILLLIGQDKKSIKEYINSVGAIPAGFVVYTSIQAMDGLFEPAINRGAGIQDANYFIKKYPNTVFQVGLYLVGALEGTIRGDYDKNIDKLADWIKSARIPVYLRIGYEFDLPENRYSPNNYKKAYRYIVEKLNKRGLNNVVYVWHSYGVIQPKRSIELWYPGDDVVDWIAISYFKTYFSEDREALVEYAAKKNKPLMIAESSPSEIGVNEGKRSWIKWYGPFFEFIERHKIQIVCYINTDWDKHAMFKDQFWGDSRVQSNQAVYSLWRQKIDQNQFIKSTYKLFQQLK